MKIRPTVFAILFMLGFAVQVSAETCITSACHSTISAKQNLHQPVKDGTCLSCHRQTTSSHPLMVDKSYVLNAKGAELCNQCHATLGEKKVVHAPVTEGDCLSCHMVHGADGRFLLSNSENQTGLCFGCHDNTPFNKKYVHGPVAVGECTACHDPHETVEKFLLKGSVRHLCLSCHADFANKMQTSGNVHPPVKNEPCTSCHNPHSSASPSLLKQALPDLCISCHKEVGKKIKSPKFPHKPVIEGQGCASCHSAHFSKVKGLLLADDEKNACLSCHSSDKLGKPPLTNIKKDLDGKKHLHGPIQKGLCGGCHDPHGSDFPRILKGNNPGDFYVPFEEESYSLCMQCHDKNLLRSAETTVDTKFRNGSKNLHYVHVNNSKGRSCRACHEAHASDGPKLISVGGAKFGTWKVRSRFKLTATGGSCAPGCHRRYGYDRVTPSDMTFSSKN